MLTIYLKIDVVAEQSSRFPRRKPRPSIILIKVTFD